MKKSEIIEEIIKEQEQVLEDLKKAIEVYRKGSDIDEEDTIDHDDLSHQAEAKEMQLNLESKLVREERVVGNLKEFKDKEITNVQSGALIETDKMFIYVGVVAHPAEVSGKKVLSISQKAPIMQKLKGKKEGETIQIGTATHTIKNIS